MLAADWTLIITKTKMTCVHMFILMLRTVHSISKLKSYKRLWENKQLIHLSNEYVMLNKDLAFPCAVKLFLWFVSFPLTESECTSRSDWINTAIAGVAGHAIIWLAILI